MFCFSAALVLFDSNLTIHVMPTFLLTFINKTNTFVLPSTF